MSATTQSLRTLHDLHQRAKALRDRLGSGPKMVAARQAVVINRQAALEAARKELQDEKVQLKKREGTLQSQQGRSDELRFKLNSVKKNDEYKAILNQLATDKVAIQKTEEDILQSMERVEQKGKALATMEVEVKTFAAEFETLKSHVEGQAVEQRAQLDQLEAAIIEAESIIPEDVRERYRRTVKQRGADALASVENNACTGCFVAVTPQCMNELINCRSLVFCKACGRILYLADDPEPVTRRKGR